MIEEGGESVAMSDIIWLTPVDAVDTTMLTSRGSVGYRTLSLYDNKIYTGVADRDNPTTSTYLVEDDLPHGAICGVKTKDGRRTFITSFHGVWTEQHEPKTADSVVYASMWTKDSLLKSGTELTWLTPVDDVRTEYLTSAGPAGYRVLCLYDNNIYTSVTEVDSPTPDTMVHLSAEPLQPDVDYAVMTKGVDRTFMTVNGKWVQACRVNTPPACCEGSAFVDSNRYDGNLEGYLDDVRVSALDRYGKPSTKMAEAYATVGSPLARRLGILWAAFKNVFTGKLMLRAGTRFEIDATGGCTIEYWLNRSDEWGQVAVTYDGQDTVALYKNGKKV